MRKFYLLINIILLIAFGCLLSANWNFMPTPLDAALKWQPETPTSAPTIAGAAPVGNQAAIRQKNLFHPLRGDEPQKDEKSDKGPGAPPRFELIGLCTIGDAAGAIIDSKNPDSGGKSEKQKRRYYAVGSEVWGGFVLESVAENSAILKRKNETLELKINRTRFGAEVGKNSANAPLSGTPPPVAMPPSLPPGVNPQRGPGTPHPGVNPQ